MKIMLTGSILAALVTTSLHAEPILKLTKEQELSATVLDAQDRGGGNPYEAEFKALGKLMLKEMHEKNLSQNELGFSPFAFEVAVNEVLVIGTDRDDLTDLFGNDRPAVNSPEVKGIVFKNALWAILNTDQKRHWVMHEYARFTGVDDSRSTFSNHALELLGATTADPIKKGSTFRITKVGKHFELFRGILFVGDVYDLYLEGIKEPAKVFCNGNYVRTDSVTNLEFNSGDAKIELRKLEEKTCSSVVAYLLTANSGSEIYLTISPSGFSFD